MLGKLIDGNIIYPPHRIVLGGMQIFNPTEEQLMQAGWKTITETAMPDDAPEGWHYEAVYTDGETITQSRVLVEDTPSPTEKTISQRVADLEEDVNGISTAIQRRLTT